MGFQSVLVWGANHFARMLPVGTWLVWMKRAPERLGTFLSDAEVAWMKGGHGVYVFPLQWEGVGRKGDLHVHHPAQKPLALMKWCIERAAPAGLTVVDPYMGSGTTLRAAKDMGRTAVGIETEEAYCEVAALRLEQGSLDLGGVA